MILTEATPWLTIPGYALVHAKYTVPPAILLTALARPLLTRTDVYKILLLATIAVVYTTPWDSYLIHTGIWSYPYDAVLGIAPLGIPLEEYFFFVIQTYITSLLYILLNKATVGPAVLARSMRRSVKLEWVATCLFASKFILGVIAIRYGGRMLYFGLILTWSLPVITMLWILSSPYISALPRQVITIPILLPTIYLCIIDTLALRRGTWIISKDFKSGIYIWPHMEIEEAIFFLYTNILITLGLATFDYSFSIICAFPSRFPVLSPTPSLNTAIAALKTRLDPGFVLPLQKARGQVWKHVQDPAFERDLLKLRGTLDAVERIQGKSRSFWIASAAFDGRLKIDLILLYSFCRVADDLVDNALDQTQASQMLQSLRSFLDLAYRNSSEGSKGDANLQDFVQTRFPPQTHSCFLSLPVQVLPREPLEEMLNGFQTDLDFFHTSAPAIQSSADAIQSRRRPIETEDDLDLYTYRVAGTVGVLCCHLIFHHSSRAGTSDKVVDHIRLRRRREITLSAAMEMGKALQYVNIARDIWVDATLRPSGRVYIPEEWLMEDKLSMKDVFTFVNQWNRKGTNPGLPVSLPGSDSQTTRPIESWSSLDSDAESRAVVIAVHNYRRRMLERANELYRESRAAIEGLPEEWGGRRGIRAAIESYMEIGRVLEEHYDYRKDEYEMWKESLEEIGVASSKASVPLWRRFRVFFAALAGPDGW